MIRRRFVLIPTLAGALALAVCGSSGSDTKSAAPSSAYGAKTTATAATTTPAPAPATAASTITLAADPDGALKFDTTALQAKAGKVTLDFTNASSVPHGVSLELPSGDKETQVITAGKTSLTTTLKPGTYEFYCPVPGHKQAGMKGELTVS